jgi:hypothetical protein
MSDEQQFEQAGGDGGEDYEPGFLVPQSEEAEMAAAYVEVMQRHPELATDAAAADAAVASAAHIADYLEIPERASDPALVEMGHMLNGATAAREAAEQQPPQADPVESILSGGKGGLGGGVLNF